MAKQRLPQLQATAYHEAGHAVAAYRLHLPYRRVSIISEEEDGTLGYLLHRPPPASFRPDIQNDWPTRRRMESHVICCFAGGEAEAKFRGRYNRVGAEQDRRNAVEWVDRLSGADEEITPYIRWLHVRSRMFVACKPNWVAIAAVAEELHRKGTLSGREVRQVIRRVFTGQRHL